MHPPYAPRRNPRPHRTNASGAPTPLPLSHLRILMVEDQEDVLETLAGLLEDRGAHVVTCDSAQEALDVLRRSDIDVVVSDIAMPDMNGWEFLTAARAQRANGEVPAIAISALQGAPFEVRAHGAGYAELLSKPVDIDRLTTLIVELTRRARDG